MALLNDLAAPSGHSTVQQALAHAILVRVAQLSDVAYVFQPLDLDALAVALELDITLKEVIGRINLLIAFRHSRLEEGLQREVRRNAPVEGWWPGCDIWH